MGTDALLVATISTVLFDFASGGLAEYPGILVAIFAFYAAQLIWPHCRFRVDTVLCPFNVAIVLFSLELIVLPSLGLFGGFQAGPLLWLPRKEFINLALLLTSLAFLSFAWAYHSRKCRLGQSSPLLDLEQRTASYPSRAMTSVVIAYLVAGFIGYGLFYGNLETYLNYLSSPGYQETFRAYNEGSLRATIGNFLRSFLGVGLVLAWCIWIDKSRIRHTFRVVLATIGLMVFLVIVNLGYNRGTMVGPIAAVLATYSIRVRRVSFRMLVMIGVPILLLTLLWGQYRATNLRSSDLMTVSGWERMWSGLNVVTELEVYGGGPQFLGHFLQEIERQGVPLHIGQSLIASVLSPVPILGKPFREFSTVTIYNRFIYGYHNSVDQIAPFAGELFLNFHIIGVVAGFGLLGYGLAQLQHRFEGARNSFEAYAISFASLWTSFLVPGSIAVVSQIFLYFLWPFYIYWFIAWLNKRPTPYLSPNPLPAQISKL